MKKTVIAIWGDGGQGKSSSIREIASIITTRFPGSTITYLINEAVDIKAIAQVGNAKIGIESQGDPGSRLPKSLADFVMQDCDIIVCATRTRGNTVEVVNDMHTIHGYDIIWTSNLYSKEKTIAYLNPAFANHILNIIDDIIRGII